MHHVHSGISMDVLCPVHGLGGRKNFDDAFCEEMQVESWRGTGSSGATNAVLLLQGTLCGDWLSAVSCQSCSNVQKRLPASSLQPRVT